MLGKVLQLFVDRLQTPIGEMILVADAAGSLRAIDWGTHESRMHRLLRLHYGEDEFEVRPARNLDRLIHAMEKYFQGDLVAIDALPVETGGTPFQRRVWNALREIPSGTTASYRELAEQIGHPTAFRAVGAANGANPISVVIPCHRLVGSNGALTGYAGGVDRKCWLLDHEKRNKR